VTPICSIQIIAKKPCYIPFPSKDDQSLGAALKSRRLALEWTQQECAKHFRVLKDSFQKWEWNEIIPCIKRQKEIVEFLGYNYWDDGSYSVSNRILLYRIEHRLYRTELANICNVSDSTIERIEKKSKLISMDMLITVEEYLK